MSKRGAERIVAEVDPDMKRRAEQLARFSIGGTLKGFVSEAVQEKIDREWPVLEPLVRVVEQRQEEAVNEQIG